MSLDQMTTSVAPIDPVAPRPAASTEAADRRRRGLRWLLARVQIRTALATYVALLRAGRWLGPAKRSIPAAGADVLITGTFHSDNWVRSHLQPLAASDACARLRIVATNPVPEVHKVEAIYPPRLLVRALGAVPARLLTFCWVAVRTRPQVVGAFHMLINGLVAAVLARWIGARAMYFCVGGPVEVLDGGVHGENKYFCRLETADRLVERWLLEAVAACDLVVTMGTRAIRFFRERGIDTGFHVVAGGIDASRFAGRAADVAPAPSYDAVLVARLVPIKAIDLFVDAIAELAVLRPTTSAVIVGDGPLRAALEEQAAARGVRDRITFAGHQHDVGRWLRQARLFVLTSHSEGLALSLMEAMTCGLPGVVPNVGDLGDLVTDGVNGYLVSERDPAVYAMRMATLLNDPVRWDSFSSAARDAARRYDTSETTALWNRVLRFGAEERA